MSLHAPNLVFQSGAWPVDEDGIPIPVPVGAPRYDEPLLPDYNGILTLRQDYVSALPTRSAPLNSHYPGDGTAPAENDYYLVDESPREDAGGYTVRFTRTWARVPNEFTSPGGVYYYSYPGLAGSATRTAPTPPQPVWCYVKRTFWLIGTGGTYASYAALVAAQLIRAQQYYYGSDPNDLLVGEDLVLDAATTPTAAQWATKIADGEVIVPEDSKIYRWQGNIFVRDTLYIPAR